MPAVACLLLWLSGDCAGCLLGFYLHLDLQPCMDARCKINGYVYVCVLCLRKCMVHVCVLSVISYNAASTDAGLITERISRSTVST